MSDRMSVSLNWDRLCMVCEKEGEEPRKDEAKGKKEDNQVARCSNVLHKDKKRFFGFIFSK